jgi:hypothetical protein
LEQLEAAKFDKKEVCDYIYNNKHNNATAFYYLLLKKRMREEEALVYLTMKDANQT